MARNKNLSVAKAAKKDEFYTQISDIEKELNHYKKHFKDAHVFCNCDDPEFSNFWRYFALNFDSFQLKQLTSTHYDEGKSTYRMDMYRNVPKSALSKETFITLEETGITLPIGYITPLEEDGDFRSKESIQILKKCDIVVTNPPFSMFREYLNQLIEFEKKFIIMGNNNSIPLKGVFNLIEENKIWLGYSTNKTMEFMVPDSYPLKGKSTREDETGIKYIKVPSISWYTNLDIDKRHEEQILYRNYTPEKYPSYDNYDAIEVGFVKDIPMDFSGVMGVPITFMDKYNPNQFDILGVSKTWATDFKVKKTKVYTNAKQHYQNGKTKAGGKVNDGAVLAHDKKPEKGIYYTADQTTKYLTQTYPRLFIKRK